MALQPGRAALAGRRQAAQALRPWLRTFASTDSSSFPASSSSTTTTPRTPPPPGLRKTGDGSTGPTRSSRRQLPGEEPLEVPRWSQTPVGMKAPVQMDFAKKPQNKIWSVNSNPARLDEMYNRLLGYGGSRMLPEELKWLAVTHKSFDQGRRGFNDRLALVGRLALVMEATSYIVSKQPDPASRIADQFGRKPFSHPQLEAIDNLSVEGPKGVVGKEKLCGLALGVGLQDVVRWKPRLTGKLKSSGIEVVMSAAVMAIIGAITLQHGSAVASNIIRDRILSKVPKDI